MNYELRVRIETLLKERGLKWVNLYKRLGWHKSFASRVLNGIIIPPLWQRVSLAKEFNVDSSVIWDEPSLITSYELKQKEKEVQHESTI